MGSIADCSIMMVIADFRFYCLFLRPLKVFVLLSIWFLVLFFFFLANKSPFLALKSHEP